MSLIEYLAKKRSKIVNEREYLDAQKRLVGIRVQADLPCRLGGYRRGHIRQLTRERQVLVECDGAYGMVWCSLDVITALEEY
jgi:hypothetical protein